ncbi:MAG: tetratricopeptide repeat protein [Bryobacterales bacterium]|nr:tetratricopeptide repeat protein [Bryobacterales bacterium]
MSNSARNADTRQPLAHLAAFLICSISIAVLYAPAMRFDFIGFDDTAYVLRHDWVRAGLTWHGVVNAFTTDGGIYWQPLTWISHMLDVSLFGLDAGAQHLQNIAWHVASALVLFSLARRFQAPVWWALVGTLFWALHPLRVESVAWIAGRKDVLSGFFFLMCLWLYTNYASAPSASRYIAMLGAAALGYLSKPTMVTLPFVLLLFDWWPLQRSWRWKLLVEKLPLLAFSAAVSWATYISQQKAGALAMVRDAGLAERIENALTAYGWYLEKTLWPTNLALIYPYPSQVPVAAWAGCALLLLAISAVVLWRRHNHPALLTGWFGFLGILIPMIGLVQAGPQPYADRFTYLSSIPLTVALLAFAAALANRIPTAWQSRAARLLASFAIGAVLMLSVRAHEQLLTWRNGETAFAHAYTAVPGNTIAAMNLGALRIERGAYAAALAPLEVAVRAEPDSAVHQYNLGAALAGLKRWEESERALLLSTKNDPSRAEAWRLLGRVQKELGRRDEAIRSLGEAVRAGLSPQEESRVRNQLGLLLLEAGRGGESEAQFRVAVEKDAGNESALLNLVVYLSGRNRLQEALPLARLAQERFPENRQAQGLAATLEAKAASRNASKAQ